MAQHHDRGLVLIGIFKLAKTALLVGVGVLLLLEQRDGSATRVIVSLAQHLRVDPDNALVHGLLERLFHLDRRKLEAIGIGTFIYAAVFATEGVGLLLAKGWAEYVTFGVTISFIPIEIFEMVKRANALKALAIAVNIAIAVYLAVRLMQRRGHRH